MFINLNTINEKGIIIDQEIEFESKYYENTIIKGLKNIIVKGKIYYSTTKEILFEGSISGNMLLVDSNSNELVLYPFSCEVNEILEEDEKNSSILDKNKQNSLDLKEILWQNIVLEVPLAYSEIDKPTCTKGDGWELKSEEEIVDPRLQGFRDLLDKEKE